MSSICLKSLEINKKKQQKILQKSLEMHYEQALYKWEIQMARKNMKRCTSPKSKKNKWKQDSIHQTGEKS